MEVNNNTPLKATISISITEALGISPRTLQNNISKLRKCYPHATTNALAYAYGQSRGVNTYRQLSLADRRTVPTEQPRLQLDSKTHGPSISIPLPRVLKPKPDKSIIIYETADHFAIKHVKEINKAYNAQCYTAAMILTRKLIENLLLRILEQKYPRSGLHGPNSNIPNIELYYDTKLHRSIDFVQVIKNLGSLSSEFTTKKGAVERLCTLSNAFRVEANQGTHSWYHIYTTEQEVNKLQIPEIVELIIELEKYTGMRKP